MWPSFRRPTRRRCLTNGAEVNCEAPFNLQEVARSAAGFIQRIDETAKKLDASVTDLRRVVLNEQTLTNFAVTIDNLRSVSERAMGTVGQPQRAHRHQRLADQPRRQQRGLLLAGLDHAWPMPLEACVATNAPEITAA